MMKKGEKRRRKEKGKKQQCSWLDLNSAPLGCV